MLPLSPGRKKAQKFGKYTLLKKIGTGGFSTVYKAVHDESKQIFALKVLDKLALQMQCMTQNIRTEIQLLTKLRHPNIVRGYEVLNTRTKLVMVMEYINGGDLHSLLLKKQSLSENEACHIFTSLIACLHYCHQRGVYHRDLKLENLLLTSTGEVKVCDFGLASVRETMSNADSLCQTNVGTEDYSSPEILQTIPYRGDDADMWSAGILLYTLLAGRFPFRGKNPRELLKSVTSCKFEFPNKFPDQPKQIVERLLVPASQGRLTALDVLQSPWIQEQLSKNADLYEVSIAEPMPLTEAGNGENERNDAKKEDSGSTSQSSQISVQKQSSGRAVRFGEAVYLSIAKANIPDFVDLMERMRDAKHGIRVENRRYRLKSYENCFIASQAVTWIAKHLGCSREEAVDTGQKMVRASVFHHVCREHDFKDEYLFFRWHDDEAENIHVLNFQRSWMRQISKSTPNEVIYQLLSELIKLWGSHQGGCRGSRCDLDGIQRDKLFSEFQVAVGEMQVVDLEKGFSCDAGKMCFVVNLYNLFSLQARIHLGNSCMVEGNEMEKMAMRFEYNIGGLRVSLQEVRETLFPKVEDKEENSEETGDLQYVIERRLDIMRKYLRSGRKEINSSSWVEMVRPRRFEPLLILFLLDYADETGIVKALREEDMEDKNIRERAGEYINEVVDIDIVTDKVRLSYNGVVAKYRKILGMQDEWMFIEHVIQVCIGRDCEEKLREMQRLSKEGKCDIVIVEGQ